MRFGETQRDRASAVGVETAAGDLVVAAPPPILILAAGLGSRWKKSLAGCKTGARADPRMQNKLTVPIEERPLLLRTLDLLNTIDHGPVWVCNQDLELPVTAQRWMPKPAQPTVLGTLVAAVTEWRGPLVLLMGDVVWSKTALARAVRGADALCRFYGKLGGNVHTGKTGAEIYALFIQSEPMRARVVAANKELQVLDRRIWLWDLYRLLIGVPPTAWFSHEQRQHAPPSELFETINDYTDDIDSLDQYLAICRYFEQQRVSA